MGMFTKIPKDTFDGMQLDAGVILNTFDPADPLGEDVDNCPVNMMELKHLDGWECSIGFTSLGTSLEAIQLALGAADVTAASGKIIPRRDLEQTDFTDLWWVGDKANGGLVAVKLLNALSTDGFSLQTTKSGKGQISVTLTGHVSIDNQEVMPMEFYSIDPTGGTTGGTT